MGAVGADGFIYYRTVFVAYDAVRPNDLNVGGAGVRPGAAPASDVCEEREG